MSPAVRLRRSDQSQPGLTRRRAGRGFVYLDAGGRRVADAETLERVTGLVIPPAWQDVWISTDPRGHLQATGIDAAGRRQYRYHDRWRELRDRQKFDHMLEFGRVLPKLRRRVATDLASGEELSRERVLGAAVRLLDVGLFRIGSHENGEEDTGLGLATVRREHVRIIDGAASFDYPAKSGVRRQIAIEDPDSLAVVTALRRRRGQPEELLAYRGGRRWIHLHADDVNDYIKAGLNDEHFSAKDFRTWNATVLAATSLAAQAAVVTDAPAARRPSTKRVFNAVVREVSEALGNTPAVARRPTSTRACSTSMSRARWPGCRSCARVRARGGSPRGSAAGPSWPCSTCSAEPAQAGEPPGGSSGSSATITPSSVSAWS